MGTQTEADAGDFLRLHLVGAQVGEHVARALGDGLQVAHRLHVARRLGQGTVVYGYQIVRALFDVRYEDKQMRRDYNFFWRKMHLFVLRKSCYRFSKQLLASMSRRLCTRAPASQLASQG